MESIDILECVPSDWEANKKKYLEFLADKSKWDSIPFLNDTPLHDLRNEQLVRFQGMIQDMYDPEYFLKQYEVKDSATGELHICSGKYRETIIFKDGEQYLEDSEYSLTDERQVWYCISVPGLNDWVSSYNNSNRRDHHVSSEAQEPGNVKRPIPQKESEEDSTGEESRKRMCTQLPAESDSEKKCSEFPLHLPLDDPNARVCFVKIYDDGKEKYSLNDVVIVIGFISLGMNITEDGDDIDMENHAVNPPMSLVPRLHAVIIEKQQHCNPLIDKALNTDILSDADSVRQSLHLVLSQLLCGDVLAADYLICHLMSSIYMRTDLLALGQISLNLCNVSTQDSFPTKFYSFLKNLVSKSHYFPMSLDKLNEETFVPKKDYSSNRLQSGVLQLSNHTHLVLDETAMQPGQLQNNGVSNMSALASLISQQKLTYQFQYYNLDFNCDIPILVLSEGKSMLPCSVVVPLRADSSCVDSLEERLQAAQHFLQAPLLDRIRVYLTVARSADYDLCPQLQKVIQDDFVTLRQDKTTRISADDLHRLLVLARLLSLSMGQTLLTEAAWKKTLTMEQQRLQRLAT